MGKKITGWRTKGMNRDTSVSVFSAEFAFENKNLRLSTLENNTLMSWVNEKGPKELTLEIDTQPWVDNHGTIVYSIEGFPIGTAVINHKLVLFTTGSYDCIYIFKYNSDGKEYYDDNKEGIPDILGHLIYKGHLNFSTEHPLETLVSYEANHIQKVYWTDGFNQPRLINVALEGNSYRDRLKRWNHEGVVQNSVDTFFDFVPTINASDITVNKYTTSGGTFAPGVIQYCYTYINKYGQQSNIADVSPLYYLTHNERGAGPEDKVGCCFKITIDDPDTNFDYVRLYSIQRTSLNLDPIVKRLEDIPIKRGVDAEYTDAGNDGDTMDPTELLFIGGREISAFTMADKDMTLFLGNIEQKKTLVNSIQNYFHPTNPTHPAITISFQRKEPSIETNNSKSIYHYEHQLKNNNQSAITTFKGGENYRFGFQLQKLTGEWTEPIYLNDATNTSYPNVDIYKGTDPNSLIPITKIELVKACATDIDLGNVPGIDLSQYQRIRPVVVFPTISDRKVLCQGVLNPTVFNVFDRGDNSPYAQASWYFRPYIIGHSGGDGNVHNQITPDSWESANVVVSKNPAAGSEPSSNITPSSFNDVYVLILNLSDAKAASVLAARSIKVRTDILRKNPTVVDPITPVSFEDLYYLSSSSEKSISFIGAVELSSSSGTKTMAFFGTKQWAAEEELPDPNTQFVPESSKTPWTFTHYIDERDCFVACIDDALSLYAGLRTTTDFRLYLDDQKVYDSGNETYSIAEYVFNFSVDSGSDADGDYYIKFISYNESTASAETLNEEDSGTWAEFMHYSPLVCQDDLISTKESDRKVAKRVEIQGSFTLYRHPFTTTTGTTGFGGGGSRSSLPFDADVLKKGKLSSNTEFFVDHSIVTLNSPDIEFDTDVQNYPNENLSMRVVGMIPITSSISAHSITTSTPMLGLDFTAKDLDQALELGNYIDYLKTLDNCFGSGELPINAKHYNYSVNGGSRLISEYLWNDVPIIEYTADEEDGVATGSYFFDFLVFPWHRSGPLNNDWRSVDKASSWLQTKKESNLLFSVGSEYLSSTEFASFSNIGMGMHLTQNAEIFNYRLSKQSPSTKDLNYYPNIDKVLYNKNGYNILMEGADQDIVTFTKKVFSPVYMKYKSTSHAVLAFTSNDSNIPILPYGILNDNSTPEDTTDDTTIGKYVKPEHSNETTYWGETLDFSQSGINIQGMKSNIFDFLWLGEIYKTPQNPFGGNTEEALIANKWVVGGPSKPIANTVDLEWTIGDTYYQRYDCLKTYPFTNDDPNQLTEILSFMCETHVNIDGRYDKNRGQVNNYIMRPENFNKLNPVYSQQDNFFTSRKLDTKDVNELKYPNHLYYSKTKTSGADVDLWTNVTLASTLELDGDKGKLNSLQRFNDQIIAFQDTGISQILYNENVQISSQQGVPIELANSGKVQGARYISDTVGCSNKWSITSAPTGIYFMDSVGKGIYLFNGQLNSLSTSLGFNTWSKKNIPDAKVVWTPDAFENFVAYYDKLNQDVLFINKETCLAFSDKLNVFTSFYSYENTPYFCNLDSTGVWVKSDGNGQTLLYKHNAGEYCNFFGVNKPYSLTLVGNIEPQVDKIFTNLEFRTCIDNDKTREENTMPGLPFDNLETWNEYQHGIAYFQADEGRYSNIHHSLNSGNNATLKRKFRIWRCDIPRDNAPISTDSSLPTMVSRMFTHPLDRMRNPWIYLKLQKEAAEEGTFHRRAEIHDIIMTYFS